MESLNTEYEFRIRWEPYMLRPNTPPEGLPIPSSYKDPNNPRVQHLRSIAASLGLVFNMERKTFASTLMGHTLLEYAKQFDDGNKQDEVAEKLFKRCFTDAEPLQEETCLNVAKECGLDVEQVKEYIKDDRNLNATYKRAISWSEKGISGVPAFYFNGHKMFSGAQEPEVFKRMFEVVVEKFPIRNTPSPQQVMNYVF